MSKHSSKEAAFTTEYYTSMPFVENYAVTFNGGHWKHTFTFEGNVCQKVHGGQRNVKPEQIKAQARMDVCLWLKGHNKHEVADRWLAACKTI